MTAASITSPRPARARVPLVVAGIVGLQLVAALALYPFDGPIGWIETEREWVNQIVPAYSVAVWTGASWWVAYWGGLIATFLALPVGLLVDRGLRSGRGPRWAWWAALWLSVVVTIAAQAVGTLDALQIIGQQQGF